MEQCSAGIELLAVWALDRGIATELLSLFQYNCVLVYITHAVIDCGSLQDLENGEVAVTETTIGSTASYSCSGSNYRLVGVAVRTCQADGVWSESAPQCSEFLHYSILFQ